MPNRLRLALLSLLCLPVLLSCGKGTDNGNPDHTPKTISVAAGDNQSAHVSTALTAAPTVVVRDAGGAGVAAVPVTFTVVDGGGSVAVSVATTDNSGKASCVWTLGATQGLNHLRASATGIETPVTFTATGTIGIPTQAWIGAGEGQSAAPGSPLPLPVMLQVQDALHTPVPGVPVTFAVTGGGGTVQTSAVLTDSIGMATCSTWVLGPTVGVNTLSATVASVAPVIFTADAIRASADLVFNYATPLLGAMVGETSQFDVRITSTYQVVTVTAFVDGHAFPLTLSGSDWTGTVSFAGKPKGPVVAIVTATDAMAHVADYIFTLQLDRPPVVTVVSPLDGSVARSTLQITATGTDDDPTGVSAMDAVVNYTLPNLITATNALSQVVDLSAWEGQQITLSLQAFDSSRQATTVNRTIYVESSPHLSVLREAGGIVWDVSGTRTLYLDTTGAVPTLKISDSSDASTQIVEASATLVVPFPASTGPVGYLTSHGAIYTRSNAVDDASAWSILEYRDGALATLVPSYSIDSMALSGHASLWVAGGWAGFFNNGPYLRDLEAGITTKIDVPTTGGLEEMLDVAANGDLVIGDGACIYRWRAGVAQNIDPAASYGRRSPVTDGVNVVYRKILLNGYQIVLNDGATETVLAQWVTPSNQAPKVPKPGTSYAAAGGYVAYLAQDSSGVLQLWRHSPSGEEKLTAFASEGSIDGIGPDGTILFSFHQKRYRATPGAPLLAVGAALGWVAYRDGKYLEMLGRDAMEIGQ